MVTMGSGAKKSKFADMLIVTIIAVLCVAIIIFKLVFANKNDASNYIADTYDVTADGDSETFDDKIKVVESGTYTSKEEVALYIYTFKKLPSNYITKKEARKRGWDSSKNNLSKVAKGKSIGGDEFKNYGNILPTIEGRKYYECDIDFNGKSRNAKRIIYADDFDEEIGFIYYTDDHYKTFEKLY